MYERLDLAVAGGETISLLDRNVVQPPPGAPVDVEEDADDAAAEDEEGEAGRVALPFGRADDLGRRARREGHQQAPAAVPGAREGRARFGHRDRAGDGGRDGARRLGLAVSGHPLLRAGGRRRRRSRRGSRRRS